MKVFKKSFFSTWKIIFIKLHPFEDDKLLKNVDILKTLLSMTFDNIKRVGRGSKNTLYLHVLFSP